MVHLFTPLQGPTTTRPPYRPCFQKHISHKWRLPSKVEALFFFFRQLMRNPVSGNGFGGRALLLLLMCGALQAGAQGKIAFTSERDGPNPEIYTMNADGSDQTNVTNNPASDVTPAFSPDGRQIVFSSNRAQGIYDLYLMNADGSGVTRLTNDTLSETHPSFSPDGRKIVFSANSDIYIMNLDGPGITRMTTDPGSDVYPSFSPDGSRIVFQSDRDDTPYHEVYFMNADGSHQVKMPNSPFNGDPSFAPNGITIVYSNDDSFSFFNGVYTMYTDGSGGKILIDYDAATPVFSPDGSKIAFRSNRDGNNEIYVMNPNGGNPVNVTNNPSNDYDPSWGVARRVGDPPTPPTVSLTIPDNIVKYSAPARIKLTAAATDEDGSITKVQFFNGNTILHTEDVYPYGFLWIDVPVGIYTLTAKAFDNSGNVTTSNGIKVSVVEENVPPVVSIASPADDTTYTGPATIHLIANAIDPGDEISKVEFYNGSTLLRTEYYYPYTYTWANVKAGTYTITAKAYDEKGLSATSKPVKIKVTNASIVSRPSFTNDKTGLNNGLSLQLGPVPARNTLQIYTKGLQFNRPSTISVLSVSGVVMKTIQSKASDKVVQLDVSSLVSGVYTLKVMSGNIELYKKFVKL